MAVDDAEKRLSVPRFITGMPGWTTAPVPDGTLDAEDRQQIAGLYRGVAAGSPVALARRKKGFLLRVY